MKRSRFGWIWGRRARRRRAEEDTLLAGGRAITDPAHGLEVLDGTEQANQAAARRKEEVRAQPISGRLSRVLRRSLGIDEALLADLPDDRAYYTRIVLQVLLVAAVAAFAGFNAVTMAMQSSRGSARVAGLGVGLAFAFLVGLVDVSLVAPRATEDRSVAELTSARRRRVAMALVLGVIVSLPLTARLFQKEAQAKINELGRTRLENTIDEEFKLRAGELVTARDKVAASVDRRTKRANALQADCDDGCTSTVQESLDAELDKLKHATSELHGRNNQLAHLRETIRAEQKASGELGGAGFGLMDRISATHEAIGTIPSIAVFLFLLGFDLSPVLISGAHGETEYQRRLSNDRSTSAKRRRERDQVADRYWSSRTEAATVLAAEYGQKSMDGVAVRLGLREPQSPPSAATPPVDEPVLDLRESNLEGLAMHQSGDLWRLNDVQYYKLLERVGQGGVAEVWLAYPAALTPRLDNLRVVKLVRRTESMGRGVSRAAKFQSVQLEKEHYRNFKNPFVPAVLDTISDRDEPYFFMEFYPGSSVDRWYFGAGCDAHMFSYDELCNWLLTADEGLRALWNQGMAWIDGKPQNMLRKSLGGRFGSGILLADFGGIAPLGENLTNASSGTYTALEARTGGRVTPAADVHSVGASLYYLLSGGWAPWTDQVYDPNDPDAIYRFNADRVALHERMSGPVTPLRELSPARSRIPAELDEMICRWMSPDPLERFHLQNQRSLTHADLAGVAAAADRFRLQRQAVLNLLFATIGEANMGTPWFGERHSEVLPQDPPIDLSHVPA